MYKFGSPALQNYIYDNWLKHALNIHPPYSNYQDNKGDNWKKFICTNDYATRNEASDDDDNISQLCVSGSEIEEEKRVPSRKRMKISKNEVLTPRQYVELNVKELRRDAEKMKILGKMFENAEADVTGQFLLNGSPASTYTKTSSSRSRSIKRSPGRRHSYLEETSDEYSSSCSEATTPQRDKIIKRNALNEDDESPVSRSLLLDDDDIDVDMDFSVDSFLQVSLVESSGDRITLADYNDVSLLESIDVSESYTVPTLKLISEADRFPETDQNAKTAAKRKRLAGGSRAAAKRPIRAAQASLSIKSKSNKRPSWMEPIIIELNGIRTYNYNYLPDDLPTRTYQFCGKRLSEASSSDSDAENESSPSKKLKRMPSPDFFDSLRLVQLSSESDDEAEASRLPKSSSSSSSESCSTCSTCSTSSSSSSDSD